MTLVNLGLTAYKTITSGPYIVEWRTVLPLTLELLVPIVIWGLTIEACARFYLAAQSNTTGIKVSKAMIILS